MDTHAARMRHRDEGLRRVGTWTRRISLAAAAGAAVLTAGYAHALPDLTAHLPGLHAEQGSGSQGAGSQNSDDQGSSGQGSGGQGSGTQSGGAGTSVQPPGAGTGPGQTTTGAS